MTVITQDMTNEQLVVRQHIEDLSTKSQLIVNESQEALFYKSGQALDLFPSGRHTLETDNIPLIKKIFGTVFGGSSPFPCDVYFINKVNVLEIVWGTDKPIDLEDPKYDIMIAVRANGQTGLRVIDSRRFVVKVVGTIPEMNVETFKRALKGMILTPVKEAIASAIVEKQISILEVTAHLSELGAEIEEKVNARIADLGIELVHFNLNTIAASDGDLDSLRKAKNSRVLTRQNIDDEAYKMQKLGYSYQEQRRFDVLDSAAKNAGAAGNLINMGVGLGVGMGVGNEIGKITSDAMRSPEPEKSTAGAGIACTGCGNLMSADARFCPYCGQAKPVAKFCSECGSQLGENAKFCANCGTKVQ